MIGAAVGGATITSSFYAMLSVLNNKYNRNRYFNPKVTAAGTALGLILFGIDKFKKRKTQNKKTNNKKAHQK
jgi:hypothetical protein